MNSVALSGRILKGATVREVNGAAGRTKLASFTLAVSGLKSALVKCAAWGKSAEFFENHFSDDAVVEIKGSLQTSKYEKNGVTIWDTSVKVEEFSFVPKTKDAPKPSGEAGTESFMQIPDDFADLPFS